MRERAAFAARYGRRCAFVWRSIRTDVASVSSSDFEGLRRKRGGFFISLLFEIEEAMELWHEAEIRMRRDDALATAERARQARLCESSRSTSIRAVAADGVQSLSDALAQLASVLRGVSRA